jgi:hypothetical protein
MAALVWLVIPVASAGAAAIWAGWTSRHKNRTGAGDNTELAGYARFREAMERSHSRSGAA